MKLKDFDVVALNNYFVAINSGTEIIDSFNNTDSVKEKYMDCTVISVHVFDEDTMVVNISI